MHRSRHAHRRQTLLAWFAVTLLVLLQVELLPRFSVTEPAVTGTADKSAVSAQYAKLPLAFEPNQGQADPSARFLVHHGQATTYFDSAKITTIVGSDHVTMSLDGANTPTFTGTDQLESKTNYFVGNDQSKWHSDVPNYQQLLAKNVYPGIDLKYYGTNSQLEHDFIVSPNANYKQIAFHFDGQENLSLDKDGNLIMKTGNSDFKLNAPMTYQRTSSTKHTIPSHFELNDNTVTIALNTDYDRAQTLIIDPVLVYSTYLGGSGDEDSRHIVVDASGNAYVVGGTSSTNFPTTSPFQGTNGGGVEDGFVTKLNPSGSALVYSTYLGGSADDIISSIAVDLSGNAYLAGQTDSTNFPTSSPYQASNAGGLGIPDGFVAKLNSTGSALTFSTYLGGSNPDGVTSIAIDASRNIYVTGATSSTNFPTVTPFQASNGGGSDAFITKFNSTGSALMYSTYLGGSGTSGLEGGAGIVVDSAGNAYVVGLTDSTNFPTSSPFQASNAGGTIDTFVTKINAAGSALTFSTYLGGSGFDVGTSIAIDAGGSSYVTGQTDSTNFPTSSPFQASNAGGNDAFVTKLNAAGSALTYSTYLGGSGEDGSFSIAVDAGGKAYLSGQTTSTNFPTLAPYQASNAGGTDVFVTELNAAGTTLAYSTYLGGSGEDSSATLAIDLANNVYVDGITASTNFPTKTPFQASNGGGASDAFITQLTEQNVNLTATVDPTLTFTVGSTSCSLGALSVSQTKFCTYALTASTNGTSGYTISYLPVATLTSGASTIAALAAQTASTLATEQFGMNLRANTAAGSHTVSPFGADVSGGSGVVAGAYNTPDSFKLVTAGDTVASAPSPSLTSTYTVSTIANITNTTKAGNYTTTLTYNIVSRY